MVFSYLLDVPAVTRTPSVRHDNAVRCLVGVPKASEPHPDDHGLLVTLRRFGCRHKKESSLSITFLILFLLLLAHKSSKMGFKTCHRFRFVH